ncbi:uncharacterized protein LOC127857044 isoform X2 [Dreissena polymorpha]|uniref:uncharacterized protein LOC127857044 isoform X2 n=1 Tax=Dreissena polymorpha TaxID=45954 RepID=UPI002263FBAE|nr:uncharacterized protein LOC127857044 isoform X2 [Dreissena polymorpha]
MEGLINILMCSIYAQIFYCFVFSKPWLDVRVLRSSHLELSCSDNIDSNGTTLWFFHRTLNGKQDMQSMFKIVYNETDSIVIHRKIIESTQCAYINHTGVICNISGEGIANTGDKWQCSKFTNESSYSRIFTLPSPGQAEEGHSLVTTEEMDMLITTSGGKTETIVKVDSETGKDSSEWNKDSTKIIAAAAGITIFVAINVSFCVYWKYRPRQIVINNTDTGKDNTTPKQIVVMPLDSPDMYSDVQYHEISDVQILLAECATAKNTLSEARVDNPNEPTFEDSETMGLAPHILRRTDMTLPVSGIGDTDKTTLEQTSFLALAEINMSDVAELESGTNRTDVNSVRYESLDSTLRADEEQYSTPV